MRFDQYMKISSPDDDMSKFRSFRIGIVKEDVEYDDVVKRLSEKYEYILETLGIVEKMNKEFRSACKGMYKLKYKLCLDENIHLSEIKIDSNIRKKIQFKQHEANEELTRIKSRFEREISGLHV
jgi:hypothetical protein